MFRFKGRNAIAIWSKWYLNLIALIFGIAILNSTHCSRYTISSENRPEIKNVENFRIKKNLGVAIVFPYLRNNLDIFTYEELVGQVKNGFLNLENNDQMIPENVEWIDTILDDSPFDYTQDYRNSTKKNVLEVQVKFDLSSRNPTFWINFMTMGIFPSIEHFNVIFKSIYHDSEGKRTHLDNEKSIVVNQIRSWFLYPLSFIENDSAYKMLKFYILGYIKESYSKIQEMNLPIGSYKTAEEPLEIPFRMRIHDLYCDENITFDRYRGDARIIIYPIYDSMTYKLCYVSLGFRNHTFLKIYSNSTDFSLFAGGKRYQGLSEIEVSNYNRDIGKREYGMKDTINLNQRLKLDPNQSSTGWETSSGVVGVYFLVPRNDVKNLDFIRWENKEISPHPSEVWIGWTEK